MSLRTKMYAGFSVMILLAFIIGAIAAYVFFQTQARLARTAVEVEIANNEATPINDILFELATNTISTGFYYYGYAYNQDEKDFATGDQYLAKMREAVDKLEKLLAVRSPDRLPGTRKALPELRADIATLDKISNDLRDVSRRFLEVRAAMPTTGAAAQQLVDKLASDTVNLARQSSAAFAADMKAEKLEETRNLLNRRIQGSAFLYNLSNILNRVRTNFWRAQCASGPEADKIFEETVKDMTECVDNLKKFNVPANVSTESVRVQYDQVIDFFEKYLAGIQSARTMFHRLDNIRDETLAAYGKINTAAGTLSAAASKLLFDGMARIKAGNDEIEAGTDWSLKILIGVVLAAFVIGIAIAVVITRGVTLPINRIIAGLSEGAEQITGASGQVLSASQALAEGATEQAASLEETSSALEEMASMTRQNADNADKTNESTQSTAKLIADGGRAMSDMATAMAEISDRSDKVSRIIKTIEDIAFQTNLLALNAAVEAARAGEAGKGFAVVADEVRNLSQRSAQAAKDTTDLINGTVESVRKGSEIVGDLTESFRAIEGGTTEIGRLIDAIASATNEQAQGVDQVNTAVAQMDKVTQQNAAGAEETSSASQHLADQAGNLNLMVGDLVTLVRGGGAGGPDRALPPPDGTTNGNGGRQRKAVPAARLGASKALPAPASSRVVNPADLIPLDGDGGEFSDF